MHDLDYTIAFITLTFMFIKALLIVAVIIGVIMIIGILAIDKLERAKHYDTKATKRNRERT